VRLQTLKPRIPSAGGRLTQLGRIEATERMRGRRAVDRRARWLAMHPLCAHCEERGRTTAASVVDHKRPLWAGGEDNYDTNGQSLCKTCHDAKTAREAQERATGG
jgi:5-methylcytosine-specific restriction protein A